MPAISSKDGRAPFHVFQLRSIFDGLNWYSSANSNSEKNLELGVNSENFLEPMKKSSRNTILKPRHGVVGQLSAFATGYNPSVLVRLLLRKDPNAFLPCLSTFARRDESPAAATADPADGRPRLTVLHHALPLHSPPGSPHPLFSLSLLPTPPRGPLHPALFPSLRAYTEPAARILYRGHGRMWPPGRPYPTAPLVPRTAGMHCPLPPLSLSWYARI